jgi:DNA-directed RNA polymerase specialized sigma24 family protein
MLDLLDPSAVFVDSVADIDDIAERICRRYGVWGDDADEFASWAKERLVENDYAILRKHRGDASMATYLAVVVTRLFHAHTRERLGRWRPSAAAERLGPEACALEMLVYRDGCRLAEAGERLRTERRTTRTDAELAKLLAQLPVRSPLRPQAADPEVLDDTPGSDQADQAVEAAERERRRGAVMEKLFAAMRELPEEDRAIIRMALAEGRKVADVARALRLDQMKLYRRIERLRTQLRDMLEERGVSRADVHELLEEGGS